MFNSGVIALRIAAAGRMVRRGTGLLHEASVAHEVRQDLSVELFE